MSAIAATQISNQPEAFIHAVQGALKTTSLKVAEAFGKRHSDVLRKIDNLDCSPEFASAHFCAHEETIQAGVVKRRSKVVEMDKDGFMFLVMGFTGHKAAQIKEAYINAFNWMANQLQPTPTIHYPMAAWPEINPQLKRDWAKDLPSIVPNRHWVRARHLHGESAPSPTMRLLIQLKNAGFDVSCCEAEVLAMRHHIEMSESTRREIERLMGRTHNLPVTA